MDKFNDKSSKKIEVFIRIVKVSNDQQMTLQFTGIFGVAEILNQIAESHIEATIISDDGE